jgi:hypothetical protein
MAVRQTSRRGTTVLYAAAGVLSLNCEFGEFYTEEDGTIEVPDKAIDIAQSHGFYRTPEEAANHGKPRTRPKAAPGVGHAPGPSSEPYQAVAQAAETPRLAHRKSFEEQVAGATRFELKDYLDGNGIEIPPRTTNDKLRELVLEHMKAEATGTLKKAEPEPTKSKGRGGKAKEGGEEPEASE